MNQDIIDLYDRFTHGHLTRRRFVDRLVVLAGGTVAANAALALLQNDYANADTIAANDPRVAASNISLDVGGGTMITCYLAKPAKGAKFPTVIVIHENRGLNPHIRDVTRRLAVAGFMACAVDLLTPMGGTPQDEDHARDMIGQLKAPDVVKWLHGAADDLRQRADSNGKVGVVGFCWGGGFANQLAVADPKLNAAVAYYGRQPQASQVPAIQAPLLLHYAGLDTATNAGIPAFENALKANGKTYTVYIYQGANHAFNNDTNAARYNKPAADLAWGRTLAFFNKYLS